MSFVVALLLAVMLVFGEHLLCPHVMSLFEQLDADEAKCFPDVQWLLLSWTFKVRPPCHRSRTSRTSLSC